MALPQAAPAWSEGDPDDLLVAHRVAGQLEAFSVLYDRSWPFRHGYTYRLLGDAMDAGVVGHDTLTRAWWKLSLYRNDNFRAWLFAIAHHTTRDRRRRNPAPGVAVGMSAAQRPQSAPFLVRPGSAHRARASAARPVTAQTPHP